MFQEKRTERQHQLLTQIRTLFTSFDKHQHMVLETIFFIDARDKDDKEFFRLTQKLVDIAFAQPTWGEPMPMAWVPLQLQISTMRSSNVHLVEKAHLKEANQQNDDLSLNEEEFERFLKVHHSLGKIVYFHEQSQQVEERLDKYVIIQPSALVNILRSFVTDKIFWPKDENLRSILKRLSSTGKINKTDLIRLWQQKEFQQLMPNTEIKSYIIRILVHLDILIEPKRNNASVVDLFLVPCMVQDIDNDGFLQMADVEKKMICLSYRLNQTVVPSALGFKLIGAALTIWPFQESEGRPYLFQNSARLSVDEDNNLRIRIEGNRITIYLENRVSNMFISPDIAASIQECLTSALTNALHFYHTSLGKNIKVVDVLNLFEIDIGVICQKKTCFIPVHEVEKRSQWTCKKECEHQTKQPLFWFFDKVRLMFYVFEVNIYHIL